MDNEVRKPIEGHINIPLNEEPIEFILYERI
jgi:hypothetical protein